MSEQLRLDNVRNALVRLEETIIFCLIERAQFCRNEIVYREAALGDALGGRSLVGYLLHETETVHARMRRYTSPDEHPFFRDLPAPVLTALRYDDNPLRLNTVNVNDDLRRVYEGEIVPFVCAPGDDGQYGSSAVCDVACLQAISKRVHYGMFVAETKFRSASGRYAALVRAGDRAALEAAITDARVEEAVLERVGRKARRYCGELKDTSGPSVDPEAMVAVYRRWIIPMNKQVQVLYLLQRGAGDGGEGA
jgi:chorismate mutase